MLIRGILIDVDSKKGTVKEIELDNDKLESFYEALNCDTIDIVQRMINGKPFDIVCDDEALLKYDPIPSAVRKDGKVMLCGNLFICNHYKEELTSLSKKDVDYIMDNVVMVSTATPHKHGVRTNPILLNTEYVRID